MNNPPDRKSLKVSTRVHSRVHQVASELSTSAAEAIGLLVDPSTVCLPLSPEQHERWTAYAEASGIPLAEWITHRIEAAIIERHAVDGRREIEHLPEIVEIVPAPAAQVVIAAQQQRRERRLGADEAPDARL